MKARRNKKPRPNRKGFGRGQAVKKDTQNSQQNQIRRHARRICDIFLKGNLISRKKNIYLAQFAAGVFQRKLKQIVVGGQEAQNPMGFCGFAQGRNCHGSN